MSEAAYDFTEIADGVIVRPMLTLDRAIDDYLADCRARGWSERSLKSYAATLYRFADRLPVDTDVAKVTDDDIRRYRASRQSRLGRNTIAGEETHIAGLTGWLHANGKLKVDPMARVKRTKRINSEDLDVTTVDAAGIRKMLAVAKPGTELNAVAILAYLGPRRHAVSRLRLPDYDQAAGLIRFHEKGAKVIWKPVPVELGVILRRSIKNNEILPPPHDYLVPPKGQPHRKGDRDDRIIWRAVKDVAERAGIQAHVHAMRAAFACFYLERWPDDVLGLKEAMGHRQLGTTQVYLRKMDRQSRMERLRGLSWTAETEPLNHAGLHQTRVGANLLTEKEGFEPSYSSIRLDERDGSQHPAPDLLGDLLRGVAPSEEIA